MCSLNNSRNVIFERQSAAGANLKKVDYLLHIIRNRNIPVIDVHASKQLIWRLWHRFLENKLLPTRRDLVVNFSPLRTGTFSIPSKVVKKVLYRLYGVWRLLNTFARVQQPQGLLF